MHLLGRSLLFDLLMLLGGIGSGALSWLAASYFKNLLFHKSINSLYPWTSLFANPDQASLINYVGVCLGMSCYGAFCYFFISRRVPEYRDAASDNHMISITILSLVVLVLFLEATVSYRAFINAVFGFVFLLILLRYGIPFPVRKVNGSFIIVMIGVALLVFVSLEPLAIIKGPVKLFNEYRKPFSETFVNGEYIRNDLFLQGIANIGAVQIADQRAATSESQSCIADFYHKNKFEYQQQNSGRGQIHHIGHIINPINEYKSGKSFRSIYMQYGLGNTLLLKWTMELLGGISVQHYYKSYVYYPLYAAAFLLMTYLIFGRTIYLLGAFSVFVISHFAHDYLVFIVAPGIIPTLHLFDVFVISCLLRYLQTKRLFYLVAAVVFSAVSVVLNFQFGVILTVSLIAVLLLHVGENKNKRMPAGLSIGFLIFVLFIYSLFFINSSTQLNIFSYFAMGLFSWRPPIEVIILTLVHLSVSYFFLSIFNGDRSHFKYLFFFIFIYNQGLFTYYFWSGLSSHLPMVVPFIGLQLFLMIFISQEKLRHQGSQNRDRITTALRLVTFFLVVLSLSTMSRFYRLKDDFLKNFVDHKTYNWTFERANVITTIEPVPILESIELIKRYSGEGKGIYLLSEYDNLLPLLSKRYSMMPLFDMSWYIISQKEHEETVGLIDSDEPAYLFVDTDIDKAGGLDQWENVFGEERDKKERKSHAGRRAELKKIYLTIKNDYEKVEEGQLISVYKRVHRGNRKG